MACYLLVLFASLVCALRALHRPWYVAWYHTPRYLLPFHVTWLSPHPRCGFRSLQLLVHGPKRAWTKISEKEAHAEARFAAEQHVKLSFWKKVALGIAALLFFSCNPVHPGCSAMHPRWRRCGGCWVG